MPVNFHLQECFMFNSITIVPRGFVSVFLLVEEAVIGLVVSLFEPLFKYHRAVILGNCFCGTERQSPIWVDSPASLNRELQCRTFYAVVLLPIPIQIGAWSVALVW